MFTTKLKRICCVFLFFLLVSASYGDEVVLSIKLTDKNTAGLGNSWKYLGRWHRVGKTIYKDFESEYRDKGNAIFKDYRLGQHKGYSEIVEADYIRLASGWGGLLLHVQSDEKSYYRLRVSTSSRKSFPAKMDIAKVENGRETNLGWAFTDAPILLKKWYKLRAITDNNGRLGLEVWDVEKNRKIGGLAVSDDKALADGRFGLNDSNCPGGTRWKNIKVKITQSCWWKGIGGKKKVEDENRRRPRIDKSVYSNMKGDCQLSIASAMEKITSDNVKSIAQKSLSLDFHLAKNEYESKQIIVIAAKDLQKVKIEIPDLRSEADDVLSVSNIEWNPIDYVYVHKPMWAKEGLYPDPILPSKAVDLQAGEVQPFLLTVYSSIEQRAGVYKGKVKIISDNFTLAEVPISVKIYNVTIPRKKHARTDIWFHQWFWEYFYDRPFTFEDYKRWSEFFGRYRVTPGWVQVGFAISRGLLKIDKSDKDDVQFDFSKLVKWEEYAVKFGANVINLNGSCNPVYDYLFPLSEFSERQQEKAMLSYYRTHLKALKLKGIDKYAIVECFDEAASAKRINEMKKWFTLIRQNIATLKCGFANAQANRGYDDYVDIFCPLIGEYDFNLYHNPTIAKRKEIWFYTCSGANHPLPDLLIFSPGIMHRIIPYMMFRFDVKGYLFWGLNYWQPLRENRNAPIKNWPEKRWQLVDNVDYDRAGDGFLCYPGPSRMPCASLRLINLRDGLEDYELLYQAKQKRKSVINTLTKIVQTTGKYVSSPSELERFRIALLQSLESE